MNQAHHRTDDADGRRIAAHAFEDFGGFDVAAFLGVEIHFQDAADRFRFGTVHQQLQAFTRVAVGFGVGNAFQAEQAFLARGQAPVDDAIDAAGQVDAWRKQDPRQDLHGALESAHRRLQQRCADGAAEYDQGCRAVGQRTEVPAFEVVAADDGDERHDDADKA
ncbi:hypothetical protein D3C86_1273350 [compost metagenome]